MDYEASDIFGHVRPEELVDDPEPQGVDYDDSDDDHTETRPDEAEEVPDPSQRPAADKPVKPKRIIKNPQPKLDAQRLMGPRGIGILEKTFQDVKFLGPGYEQQDLNVLMKQLEHWAHRLYPRLPFDQTIKQIEKLGTKKNVQVQMKKLRQDLFSTVLPDDEEDNVTRLGDDQPEENQAAPIIDIFDQLIGDAPISNSTSTPRQITSTTLSDEQQERIERNKRLAAERRLQKTRKQVDNSMNIDQSLNNVDAFDNLRNPVSDNSIITNGNLKVSNTVEINLSSTLLNDSRLTETNINTVDSSNFRTDSKETETNVIPVDSTLPNDSKVTETNITPIDSILPTDSNVMETDLNEENECNEEDMLRMIDE